MASVSPRGIVIFSGGSAANSLVDVFEEVREKKVCSLSYVVPISDNGGSSSELIRVFGGPGIGDIRSRLVRLIPPHHAAIRALFNHRLRNDPQLAFLEFQTLLLGTSDLYNSLPQSRSLLIRSIFAHLHGEILKRSRPPYQVFNFQSASIGNLFLTGARLFSGSFESAIYLLAVMGGVNENQTAVLPSIVSNFTNHISAGLTNGMVIAGQNAISHPSAPTALQGSPEGSGIEDSDVAEDANLPGSLPTLRQPNIEFSKLGEEELPSKIERIWYINPYGQEMRPAANPKALEAIRNSEAVIYSIGSLYTSIAPSLILRGIGEAIATSSDLKYKILIVNGSLDRETGGFEAKDFVAAISRAAEESQQRMGVADVSVYRRYVTHLIYLEGDGTPTVNKQELARWGVECIRLYGRRSANGNMIYDGKALSQALSAILGKKDLRRDKSRRNTLEH